ncbi:hypothetical protein [Rhodococcus sp. 008]|uniref:hypothetical protein n=1 Tax=Rhodococcus sp. 008 TaxID=1723645 RepID=UPI0008061203|nr:hypothetical protein [Rhodococcus sp. 008]ANQ73192.1 hypothetical protein AOT96_21840 [Rhodococcus sp. 008]
MSANHIEALAKSLYENGNPQHTAADRAMLGPFEALDALQQTIWIDLANAAHNHLTQADEGTTDAGLADLIAAHTLSGPFIEYDSDGHHVDDIYLCGKGCKWTSNEGAVNRSEFAAHAAHVALVVEQHTNRRIAPVLKDFDWHIQNASNGAVFAAVEGE